jgi:hypothetical protein
MMHATPLSPPALARRKLRNPAPAAPPLRDMSRMAGLVLRLPVCNTTKVLGRMPRAVSHRRAWNGSGHVTGGRAGGVADRPAHA